MVTACLSGAATGGEIVPLSVGQLTAKAQLVLQGTVLSKTCQRDPQGRIFTAIDFQVSEVWKGNLAADRFRIVHGGGVLGQEAMRVVNQAEYRVGEEAVVFLVLNQRGEGVSIGLCQGKFRVWRDPESGSNLADNGLVGRTRLTTAAGIQRAEATMITESPLTVAALKQQVRAHRRSQ